MTSKLDYLKKYVSTPMGPLSGKDGDSQGKKKKRKKDDDAVKRGGSLQIIDEDTSLPWKAKMKVQQAELEDEVPVVVEIEENNDPLRKFKTKQSGSWATVDANPLGAPGSSSEHGRDQDPSPPRRRVQQQQDASPPRHHALEADASPPRRRQQQHEDSSPPRRSSGDAKGLQRSRETDVSPPRRRQAHADSSPPRRQQSLSLSADASPPRRHPQQDDEFRSAERKIKKMSTGESAGLRSARDVRDEAFKRREDEATRLGGLDPSISGRDADTVYRDKRGRPLEMLGEFMRQQKGEFVAEEEKGNTWGRGIVQEQKKEEARKRLEEEKFKPFARYADDEDLDSMYKSRDRWGDPMAGLTKKKGGAAADQKKPQYRGPPPPPNRFGIPPGYRWDGVHRSNGFEAALALGKNERSAKALEAYLWSAEDM